MVKMIPARQDSNDVLTFSQLWHYAVLGRFDRQHG